MSNAEVFPAVPGAEQAQVDEVLRDENEALDESTLPMRKRKMSESGMESAAEKSDSISNSTSEGQTIVCTSNDDVTRKDGELKPLKRPPMSKAREIRLEQNRKAARESRRRKKIMIEELQRSVIFFSRANGTLKQQNEELQRLLIQAQAQVQSIESGQATTPSGQAEQKPQVEAVDTTNSVNETPSMTQKVEPDSDEASSSKSTQMKQAQKAVASATAQAQQFASIAQQAQAQATQVAAAPPVSQVFPRSGTTGAAQAAETAATQALYEAQGYPPAAARAAAQTFAACSSAAQGVNLPNASTETSSEPATPQAAPDSIPRIEEKEQSKDAPNPQTQLMAQAQMSQVPVTAPGNPWPFLMAMAPHNGVPLSAPMPAKGTETATLSQQQAFSNAFAMQYGGIPQFAFPPGSAPASFAAASNQALLQQQALFMQQMAAYNSAVAPSSVNSTVTAPAPTSISNNSSAASGEGQKEEFST